MPRLHTHLTWEEQMKRRRETMDSYHGVVLSNCVYLQRKEMKEQKKIITKTQYCDFNFLQYLGIIYKWAGVEYGMRRVDIDFLLYLHAINTFTTKEFHRIERMYGTVDFGRWNRFKDNGYVVFHSEHRTSNRGGPYKVWTISHKHNRLVTSMHRKLLFLEPLPVCDRLVNKMRSEVKDYDDLLREFNEKVRKKADEKSA